MKSKKVKKFCAKQKKSSDKNESLADQVIPKTDNSRNSSSTTGGSGSFVFNYFEQKINKLRSINFNVKNVTILANIFRRKIGLGKSPKNKGYHVLMTDEEKRYIIVV